MYVLKVPKSNITKRDLSALCRQIYFIVSSGVSISKAVEILIVNMKHQKSNAVSVMEEIYKNILEGKSFSESLFEHKDYFPMFMIRMVKSGEDTGSLPEVMEDLADYFEQEYNFKSQLKMALVYPVIVLIMLFVVLGIAVGFVIPSYAQMFLESGADLPLITKFVIAISNFVTKNYLMIFLFFILAIVSAKMFLETSCGKFFYGKLLFNLSGIYKSRINFLFAQVFGMMTSAGVNVIFALESVRDVLGNKFLDNDFDLMVDKIKGGKSLTQVISESNIFSYILVSMINIGESSGNLTEVMFNMRRYFSNEFTNKLMLLQKYFEPFITILVGIILGIVMIAIVEPTFMIGDII